MTVPSDRRGSRHMSNLVQLEWRAPPPAAPAPSEIGGATSGVTVYGAVDPSMRFDVAILKALPTTTLTVAGGTYTGTSLWTLLNTVTYISSRNSPQKKYPTLRMAAVATAADGYSVLLALGEIDPTFGNRNVTRTSSGAVPAATFIGQGQGNLGWLLVLVDTNTRPLLPQYNPLTSRLLLHLVLCLGVEIA